MIKISVCMIVKNEEMVLQRCLDSLAGIADEIVIADTGSTDRTKETARAYTDKIYDFKWNDDFSAARNFVFSKAGMDYIYSADADEIIDAQNRKKFLCLKENLLPEVEIVQMKYKNQLKYNTAYNFDTEYRPKLFKRLRTFCWVGPVHETVDLNTVILNSDVAITHMPVSSHAGRDFSALERAAKPLDSRLHRMYAKELFIAGKPADFFKAYTYFESTLHDENRSVEDVRVSQCVVVKCAALRKDSGIFFKTALKNTVGEPCAEVCCELGAYFYEKRDYEEAATWYYTAAFGAQSELNIRFAGDIPLKGLSKSYLALGFAEKAEEYKRQAEKWTPPLGLDN